MNGPRGLPLVGLRVLEACARHRNFSRAAEELGITPGAVTQHVRALEEWVGAPLFIRAGREFMLADILKDALPHLHEGFTLLTNAGRILRASRQRGKVVSVSAPPSFASKWLLPRLDGFRAIHPEIEVWVSADNNLIDFARSAVDLAIRYGSGHYDELTAEKLFAENVVPVAAPEYLARSGPIREAVDLLRCRLLHDLDQDDGVPAPDWAMWFRTRGVVTDPLLDGPRYNQSGLVVEEAVAGKGIALARTAIAQNDLDSGRLRPVLSDVTELTYAYWLVWPRYRTLLPPTRAFVSWLNGQTIASEGFDMKTVSSGS